MGNQVSMSSKKGLNGSLKGQKPLSKQRDEFFLICEVHARDHLVIL